MEPCFNFTNRWTRSSPRTGGVLYAVGNLILARWGCQIISFSRRFRPSRGLSGVKDRRLNEVCLGGCGGTGLFGKDVVEFFVAFADAAFHSGLDHAVAVGD